MAAHFHPDFLWRGNQGCLTRHGIEAFRRNWQLPLRAAISDRVHLTEKLLADADRAACFGQIEATHSGPFMGIAPTVWRVRIPTLVCRVEYGRIAVSPVFVDFASVLVQLGRDPFDGEGWDAQDRGERTPRHPERGARPDRHLSQARQARGRARR